MPYSLASKTGVMLSSRDVRASVPKYMVSVPKYIFQDTSDYQFQLFVERANSALGWCTMFVSRVLQTVQERRQSAFVRLRTGVPLFIVSQNRCRALATLTCSVTLEYLQDNVLPSMYSYRSTIDPLHKRVSVRISENSIGS